MEKHFLSEKTIMLLHIIQTENVFLTRGGKECFDIRLFFKKTDKREKQKKNLLYHLQSIIHFHKNVNFEKKMEFYNDLQFRCSQNQVH